MDFIRKNIKEILIVLGIVAICTTLMFFIFSLLSKQSDLKFQKSLVELQYNNIMSGAMSEDGLNEELEGIRAEIDSLSSKLPENYRIQNANMNLIDIVNATNFIDLENCIITELGDIDGYKRVEVRVKGFYSNYNQIKKFMEFVRDYPTKITIDNMEFEREGETSNMEGRTLVFTLYGMA